MISNYKLLKLLAVFALVWCAVVLQGCGGDDDVKGDDDKKEGTSENGDATDSPAEQDTKVTSNVSHSATTKKNTTVVAPPKDEPTPTNPASIAANKRTGEISKAEYFLGKSVWSGKDLKTIKSLLDIPPRTTDSALDSAFDDLCSKLQLRFKKEQANLIKEKTTDVNNKDDVDSSSTADSDDEVITLEQFKKELDDQTKELQRKTKVIKDGKSAAVDDEKKISESVKKEIDLFKKNLDEDFKTIKFKEDDKKEVQKLKEDTIKAWDALAMTSAVAVAVVAGGFFHETSF
jgi:hypothetical protein